MNWIVRSAIALAAIAALVAGLWFGSSRQDEPAPDAGPGLLQMPFKTLALEPAQLGQRLGTPVLVNFWATWCAPCREEIPLLNRLQAKNAGKLKVIGVAFDEVPAIRRFQQQVPVSYEILVADVNGIDLLHALGNRQGGLPYSLLLDANGQVLKRHLGPLTEHNQADFLAPIAR